MINKRLFLGKVLRWSSDERFSHRRTDLRPLANSGERMLAGGGSVAGGHTPAKPLWSVEQLSQRFFLPIHLLQPSEEINPKFLPLYGLATKEKQAGVPKKVAQKKIKRTGKKVQEENEHV